MGGVVNVAIRFPDGRAVCQERWTNNTPYWFRNAKLFNGNIDHIQEYLDLTKGNDFKAGELGAPQPLQNSEYGLIVIDLLTMTFLENNTYSTFNRWSPVNLYSNHSDPSDREVFYELVNSGKIYERVARWDERDFRGTCNYVTGETPLTVEQADKVGEKWLENFRNKYDRSGHMREDYDFVIDTNPMVYIDYPELETTEMRKKLRELNFPMSKKEGLNV
jgi:hypothetical protein